MRWQNITSGKMAEAIELSKGVCVLWMGGVEHYGKHLPLGVDVLNGKMAELAAEKEPVVMFPDMYFGEKWEPVNIRGQLFFQAN